ncbi:hypothetical protein [Geomicrobium sp. JCM 19038]|uniref:hypothetical protein n=1 Tax=Geomicrobium sp. JCM 19038 TaxID=1460635 RepID=UPI00045F2037|nr:hypothetical protein [Geomicrobium sp. JCM 19038]GAK09614.1 hypothetical protein JCM19038_3459 [Geomicrobium sp. JCM 19038]
MSHKVKNIKAHSVAARLIAEVNGNQEEKGYLTFITNIGHVVGKIMKYEIIGTIKDDEGDEILDYKKENYALPSYVETFYEMRLGENEEPVDTAIYLSDVSIYYNGNVDNINYLTLYADHVVGILPGDITKHKV